MIKEGVRVSPTLTSPKTDQKKSKGIQKDTRENICTPVKGETKPSSEDKKGQGNKSSS